MRERDLNHILYKFLKMKYFIIVVILCFRGRIALVIIMLYR